MTTYEHVFIARQDISGTQAEALAETFSSLVGENGGTVTKTEYWGLKNLTYRIKKNRKGHYLLMNLDAPSDAVLEMERQMRLHDDILRYLTIRVDEVDEEPSVMMKNKGGRDRDERGDRGERGGRDRDDRGSRDRDDKPEEKKAAPKDDDTSAKPEKAEVAEVAAEAAPEAATDGSTEKEES